MAGTKKPHKGVALIKPSGRRTSWRGAYASPDTGKRVFESLDPVAFRTAEARHDWAIRKTKELARRRIELEAGAPRATGLLLTDAVLRYFETHAHLRPRTLQDYRTVATKLLEWSGAERILRTEDLTRARLMAFREALIAEPKHHSAKGRADGGPSLRGKKIASLEKRSAHTVNRELRSTRVVLGYLSELDLLPRLTHDDLRRGLKRLAVSVERLEFLRTPELVSLVSAAITHDRTLVKQTGKHKASSTYPAIAPFVMFTLLAGTRLSEGLELTWGQVDLAEREIRLTGATKTKRARAIDLTVSEGLHSLLQALRSEQPSNERVFSWLKRDTAIAAAKRLRSDFGAPSTFTYHALRRTCGTALTNAPGIFGGASAYRSAKQLGHSVAVAEKHYVGVLRGVPVDAKTVEAALSVQLETRRVVDLISERSLAGALR